MNPYTELINFVVSNVSADAIESFRASDEMHDHVYELIEREKAGIATEKERHELDKHMEMEHLIRMIKIRAKESLYVTQ